MGLKKSKQVHYRFYGASDKGRKRENNEDSFVTNKKFGFFAVADGMGGHAKGEVASRMATEISENIVSDIFFSSESENTFPSHEENSSDEEKIQSIVEKANKAIYSENRIREEKEKQAGLAPQDELSKRRAKMGTTLVCAKIVGQKMVIANAGDSRCYLIRKNTINQLTEDHSKIDEALQSGQVTQEEINSKKMRNYITSALGTHCDFDLNIVTSLLKKGDIYVLCSDGLTNMLNDEKIFHTVHSQKDIKKACHDLIRLANEFGGLDNITVVLIEITGVETVTHGKESGGKHVKHLSEDTMQ